MNDSILVDGRQYTAQPQISFRMIFPGLTNERILPLLTKSRGFLGTGTRRPPQEHYFKCYCSYLILSQSAVCRLYFLLSKYGCMTLRGPYKEGLH